MAQKNSQMRRILLVLIILLLGSISYLALEASLYYEGQWQAVQGSGVRPQVHQVEPITISLPEKQSYSGQHWDVIRQGRLFFEPQPVNQAPKVQRPSQPTYQKTVEPPKPTCPWVLLGVLYSSDSTAILGNKQSQTSQTVKVGSILEEFEVMEIHRDHVLVKSPEAEFKLELGGK